MTDEQEPLQELRNEKINRSAEKAKVKSKKPLNTGVTISPSGANSREITITYIFNAPSINKNKLNEIIDEVYKDTRPRFYEALELAVTQEQKWVDATRQ
jgi:hypothetical protein